MVTKSEESVGIIQSGKNCYMTPRPAHRASPITPETKSKDGSTTGRPQYYNMGTNSDKSVKADSRENPDYIRKPAKQPLPLPVPSETRGVDSSANISSQNDDMETKSNKSVKSNQSRKNSDDYMIPRPAHHPPLPPVPSETKGVNSTTNNSLQNPDRGILLDKKSKKPPPLTPPRPSTERRFPVYCDRDNPNLQSRNTSPLTNPKEEHYFSSASSHYTYANPPYIEVLPDHDFNRSQASTRLYAEGNHSTYDNIYQLSPDDIPELLFWLKKVSRQSDNLTQYGLSEDEEIRSFDRQANHVRKARRLYQLLMMKRKETLQNTLKEFQAICDKLDKVQKTNKAMGIAGGATGAVGGVTAVVGVALAPMTMGVSLIATAVGAGIAASAGGFGAHAAKANKKIVNRQTVEKLVKDYEENVVDIEHCLNYILCMMKELQRHNIGKLKKTGANPDTLRMVDLSQAVLRNNMYRSRQMSPISPGGMSSGSLLKNFVSEFYLYFTEKNGQKLKKTNKSKFSGRVCILVTNLQEELNYLIQMWEALA
ncbi:PREDICTED: uncharacterized protein LOC107087169 [Cyprinodon variegatus]|uniref:uncharacterized protein LOC107087169 n=1 Tax=Cyprinodon variegatus TaxID=28743 RepID=UPI00074296DF|nr:PREDICTED: uncharacterized protein LOC107087169 [Cyprinodon variegatus]